MHLPQLGRLEYLYLLRVEGERGRFDAAAKLDFVDALLDGAWREAQVLPSKVPSSRKVPLIPGVGTPKPEGERR